jgi:hypothetical protein
MPKLETIRRFAAKARLWPTRDSIRLDLRRTGRLGDFQHPVEGTSLARTIRRYLNVSPNYNTVNTNVNTRSLLHVMRLLDEMHMSVFANLGRINFDFWWRTRLMFKNQHWALLPSSNCRVVIEDRPNGECARPIAWTIQYGAEPFFAKDHSDVAVPYGMDPVLAYVHGHSPLPRDQYRSRPIRVLFAGRCGAEAYDRGHLLWQRYGKLTRSNLVQHLRSHGLVRELESVTQLREILSLSQGPEFIFIDTERFSIPASQWLEVLAASDFFFCPPGTIMPMCHNIVEALAVGTIPITSYAEWLAPPLVDGETCLGFSTSASLENAIETAFAMPQLRIRQMRQEAMKYYDTNLDYRSIANRLKPRMGEPLRLHVLDETIHRVEALPVLYPPLATIGSGAAGPTGPWRAS